MYTGKFVVVEGLEGAGKSTAIDVIKSELEQAGIDYICTREPGGTEMAEQIRSLVKQHREEIVAAETELLLMYAARVQLVENVIKPALEQGKWVIGDRHNLSTQAYQGGGRGIDMHKIDAIKHTVLGDFAPDATLFLDVSAEIGLARARGRGELDRIEKEESSFFDRIRLSFISLLASQPNHELVNANQDMNAVHNDIKQVVRRWVSLWNIS